MILDAYKDRLWGKLLYDVCVVAVEGGVYHPSSREFDAWFADAGFEEIDQHTLGGLTPMLLTIGRVPRDQADASPSLTEPAEVSAGV